MTATQEAPTSAPVSPVEPRWQDTWELRFTALVKDAGLSSLQEACYRGHLRGLNSAQIAEGLYGPLGACPAPTEKRKRKSWHRAASLRQIRVDCAVVQAEERIAQQFPQFGTAGNEFTRNLLACFRNRGENWARIEFIQLHQDEPQRCPSPRVVTADDLPRLSRPDTLRLFVQGLAENVEDWAFSPIA